MSVKICIFNAEGIVLTNSRLSFVLLLLLRHFYTRFFFRLFQNLILFFD